MENHPATHCPLLRTIVDNGTAGYPKKEKKTVPKCTFWYLFCSGQRKLEQLSNPVISQRSAEIPVTRLGPSPAQTVFHAWFQGFFTPFRMTNVQTTLDQYSFVLFQTWPSLYYHKKHPIIFL